LANSSSRWLPLQFLNDCTSAFQIFRNEQLTSGCIRYSNSGGVGVDVAKAAESAIKYLFKKIFQF
jgi:hypothetical protein